MSNKNIRTNLSFTAQNMRDYSLNLTDRKTKEKMEVSTVNSPGKQNRIRNSSKIYKRLIYLFIVVLLAGFGLGFYLYNKPHQGIANEEPVYSLSAVNLVKDYDASEEAANAKYLGKVLEVKGIIAEKTKDEKGMVNVTLQGPDLAGVGCQFDPKAQEQLAIIKEGQEVVIKGICTGVLMDVVMVDCVITNDNK